MQGEDGVERLDTPKNTITASGNMVKQLPAIARLRPEDLYLRDSQNHSQSTYNIRKTSTRSSRTHA